ncbi:J domain-containing protein [Actinophytocola sp. NPDC049390]|uniref:J domain-containing protein n=1 Tax=Actinophytocola sp. NPDC049390 TaxID=3363894 RepID=UPI0037945EB1
MLVRGIDYYELLGVAPDASSSEIRSAYRALAKAMHPDTGGTAGAFRLLREAYDTLTDPERRADYDRGDEYEPEPEPPPPPPPVRTRGPRQTSRYVPTLPVIEPDTIPWWDEVRRERQVVLEPTSGPSRTVTLMAAGATAFVVLATGLLGAPSWLLILFLLVGGAATVECGRRHLAALRVDREFTAEFGDRKVFGAPGQEEDEAAERLTADLLARYLTRIPGVRVCHGLAAEEGSVFADLHHAVLCGRRLVLIESKSWLPGHYDVDNSGDVLRNGRPFRGGTVSLPTRLAVYRALLPDTEIRGALLIYPSRAGTITVGDGLGHTPERFVREIGAWLAAEPSTVEREMFSTLLRQVVSPG